MSFITSVDATQDEYENAMIQAYVPEADILTREVALKLACERDEQEAVELEGSAHGE